MPFIKMETVEIETLTLPGQQTEETQRKYFLETYGCQMNFSDSEIVASILNNEGYSMTTSPLEADIILMNTCAIRDNAEDRVRRRLSQFGILKRRNPGLVIGLLGCMAERLKTKLLEEEKLVDMIVGPDAYRSIPVLIEKVDSGQKGVNVLLSREETYSDLTPVRLSGNGITAFISIMRGCDNMCSFCVVPFTRGRERSRSPETIVAEATQLFEAGYREVTLLGQNVDSYWWYGGGAKKDYIESGVQGESPVNFARLLETVAKVNPELRVRFSTSNPQDMTDDVLIVMAKYPNICKYVHLPMQSGSSAVLKRMNRGYDRTKYLDRIAAIKRYLPDGGITTDIIAGFCGETEEEYEETLSLINEVKFDFAYMFKYSERPGTQAAKQFKDDIPEEEKSKRLASIIELQRKLSMESNKNDVGKEYEVLAESFSKRSPDDLFGRNTQNKGIVFSSKGHKPGDYVKVKITGCTSGTLTGEIIEN
jgi:tRNA-2-methylthio-N6-dimethylallyladenosine synthase